LSLVTSFSVAGMTLILGVDRFMSECRKPDQLHRQRRGTIAASRWEGGQGTPRCLPQQSSRM